MLYPAQRHPAGNRFLRLFQIPLATCSLAILLAFPLSKTCAGPASPEWTLVPEPAFMRPDICWPIPGSRSTVLLPLRIHDLSPLTAGDTKDPSPTLPALRQQAARFASQILSEADIQLIRNSQGIILYATIHSQNPLTASCFWAEDFAEKFAETIGPDLLLAIPNRFTIYVFSRSFLPVEELAERVFVDYHATSQPVSREIFELRDGQLIAIGRLR